jgi:hypothetical protein
LGIIIVVFDRKVLRKPRHMGGELHLNKMSRKVIKKEEAAMPPPYSL